MTDTVSPYEPCPQGWAIVLDKEGKETAQCSKTQVITRKVGESYAKEEVSNMCPESTPILHNHVCYERCPVGSIPDVYNPEYCKGQMGYTMRRSISLAASFL